MCQNVKMELLLASVAFLVSIFVADAGVSMHNEFYCYSTDPIRSLVHMHSVQSAYGAVRSLRSVNPTVSSCTPSRFWMVGRHATRFPFANIMEEMIALGESSIQADIVSNYELGRTTLCRQDFEAIRDWTRGCNFQIEYGALIPDAGKMEMQNIARRYQQLFPHLLPDTYSPDRFHFRHTSFPRFEISIQAFAGGLFGENESQNVTFESNPDRDTFLRPTDFCPAWSEATADQHQREAFLRGPEIEEMVGQVNRKLGFYGSNQLSIEKILIMWEWCRFETASTFELSNSEIGENSTWCAPFSISHQILLEYYDDLFYFHLGGYGVRNRRLMENLNCGLMQDLLTYMQSDNDTVETARIFVAGAPILHALFVTFGLFRDTFGMHQHNFAQQTAREWMMSLISPNAAHLAVIRYDCTDGDHDLVFLLNERHITLPGCDQQTGICKLSVIVNRFQRFIGSDCEEIFCSSD